MSNTVYSNENDLIKAFFQQGGLKIVQETILIVVGTSIGAERYDRMLAQLIKRILANLDIGSDIITDTFYTKKIENLKRKKNAMICLGYTNPLIENYVEKNGRNRHQTTAKIYMEDHRPIALIYGQGVPETREATIEFCKKKLAVFLGYWSYYTGMEKDIKNPSNIEGLLADIISTISRSPLGTSAKKTNNQEAVLKMFALQKKLEKYKFAFLIALSVILAISTFLVSSHFIADIGISVTIFLAVIFGVPTVYAIYPKKKK